MLAFYMYRYRYIYICICYGLFCIRGHEGVEYLGKVFIEDVASADPAGPRILVPPEIMARGSTGLLTHALWGAGGMGCRD